MRTSKKALIVLILCHLAFAVCATSQGLQSAGNQRRLSTLSELSKQLRWQDEEGRKRYMRVASDLTREALLQIDGFVTDNIRPGTGQAEAKAAVDALLVKFRSPGSDGSSVFWTELPDGRFLILSVDLLRVTGATSEDAVSVRAYKVEGGRLVFVAQAGEELTGRLLYPAVKLSEASVPSQCRFIIWGGYPAIGSPYSLRAVLYSFEGDGFRVRWQSPEFRTREPRLAARATGTGFAVRRLSEPDWQVIEDQFIQTPAGAEKVAEIRLSE